MDENEDLKGILDDLRAGVPPPLRAAEHRAALLRRAESVTGDEPVRLLIESASVSAPTNASTFSSKGHVSDHADGYANGHGMGRGKRMKKRTIIALAAALMVVSTAVAQQIIQFFAPDDDDKNQTTVYFEPQPDFDGHEEAYLLPTLDELAPSLPFVPRLPAALPTGYELETTHFDDKAQQLETIYVCNAGRDWGFSVIQRPISAAELAELPPMNVGASAVVEDVLIGDTPGQYVHGMWLVSVDVDDATHLPESAQANMQWSNDAPAFTLRWHADGMLYSIISAIGGSHLPENTRCLLDKDAVVATADSLAPYSP